MNRIGNGSDPRLILYLIQVSPVFFPLLVVGLIFIGYHLALKQISINKNDIYKESRFLKYGYYFTSISLLGFISSFYLDLMNSLIAIVITITIIFSLVKLIGIEK